MPDYRRYRIPGGTYFFTINSLERCADWLVRYIDALCEFVELAAGERFWQRTGFVVRMRRSL